MPRPLPPLARLASLLVLCLLPLRLQAQVPEQLAFQGLLSDPAGQLVPDGTYRLSFRLYDQPSGGEALWTEQQTLAVAGGLFSTMLGRVQPLALPFDRPYFYTVQVEGQAESQRVPLTAAPYSLSARVAQEVAGGKVVRSLSGLRDEVELVAGEGVRIEKQANRLVISAPVGLRAGGAYQKELFEEELPAEEGELPSEEAEASHAEAEPGGPTEAPVEGARSSAVLGPGGSTRPTTPGASSRPTRARRRCGVRARG